MNEWKSGVDYPNYMNEESLSMLKGGYLIGNETPADAIKRIANAAETRIGQLCTDNGIKFNDVPEFKNLSEKFQEIIWKNEFCPSSPMWSNMGTDRGYPISCFGSFIEDNMPSISFATAEMMMMSALGGGCSTSLNELRGAGSPIKDKGKSKGSGHFEDLLEEVIKRIDQGEIRKGAVAFYLGLSHPDFWTHMDIREKDSSVQRATYAVTVTKEDVAKIRAKDPELLKRWARVLKDRSKKGMPYIFYVDNANENKPQVYKDLGLKINHTNLCTEIMLPNSSDESFVCCVASINMVKYDSIRENDTVFYSILFMEAVMEDFIRKLSIAIDNDPNMMLMQKALRFAKRHRALGLGVLGYHSYLQKNMIPYESSEANMKNSQMFRMMRDKSDAASERLAELFGEPEVCKGYGMRHSTKLAVAPTTSNASISGGWSPSTEVSASNFYVVKLAKGKYIRKNPFLDKILAERLSDKEYNDIWKVIMQNGGSILKDMPEGLLSDAEKDVFKTFKETNQMEVVRQAAVRQTYIDQGQSINLNFPPDAEPREINKIILEAHDLGIKSLYYQRSESTLRKTDDLFKDEGCITCEG